MADQMYLSWGIFLTLGGAAAYYYLPRNTTAKPAAIKEKVQEVVKEKTGSRDAKTKRKENAGKSAQAPKEDATVKAAPAASKKVTGKGNKKPQNQAKVNLEPVATSSPKVTAAAPEEKAVSDREFAEMMATMGKNSVPAASSGKEARSKTVKQAAAKVNGTGVTSAPVDHEPSGKDVSDMLEAPAPGPSVVRLTESANLKPAKKAQPKQAPPAQETKKQRQNRRKVEEQKAQKEQDEKDRRILMEKQLRAARESRGEPAKNGETSAPNGNAWTESKTQAQAQAPTSATAQPAQLLDTFDRTLPAEEEQVRLAMEESNWATVPTKGRGQKKAASSDTTANEEADAPAKAVEKPAQENAAPAPAAKHGYSGSLSVPSFYEALNGADDDEWAA